jgi:glycine/sarcosine N-methyltransferase
VSDRGKGGLPGRGPTLRQASGGDPSPSAEARASDDRLPRPAELAPDPIPDITPSPQAFDDYDRFVDWDKRLSREAPLFRGLFDEHGVRTVVDLGCGTGRHAVLFASWGLHVTGVDPDPEMLARAREHARERGVEPRFLEGGFGGLARLGLGPADALTCTGNALPHVDGTAGLRAALADAAVVLRPGGAIVLHLLNHTRLISGAVRTVPPVVRDDESGTTVFLRVMDHIGDGIRFDFVTLHRPAGTWESGGAWAVSSRRSTHTALPSPLLERELASAGFVDVRLFGDHSGKSFDPAADESVIVTAVRR